MRLCRRRKRQTKRRFGEQPRVTASCASCMWSACRKWTGWWVSFRNIPEQNGVGATHQCWYQPTRNHYCGDDRDKQTNVVEWNRDWAVLAAAGIKFLRVTLGKQYSPSTFQFSSLCISMKPFRSTGCPFADPTGEKKPAFARSDRYSE